MCGDNAAAYMLFLPPVDFSSLSDCFSPDKHRVSLICIGLVIVSIVYRLLLVPVIVAVILAVACGYMLRFVLVWYSLGPETALEDYAISTIISLGVSALIVRFGYATVLTEAYSSIALCLLILFSGILVVIKTPKNPRAKSSGAFLSSEPVERLAHAAIVRDEGDFIYLANAIGPVVHAALICAFSLGTALVDPSIEQTVRSVLPFVVGALCAIAFLAILAFRWHRRGEEQGSEIVVFMSVPCAFGIMASMYSTSVPFSVVYAIIACSNLLFSCTSVDRYALFCRAAPLQSVGVAGGCVRGRAAGLLRCYAGVGLHTGFCLPRDHSYRHAALSYMTCLLLSARVISTCICAEGSAIT